MVMSEVPANFLDTKTADLLNACERGVADACEYVAQREEDPAKKGRLMDRVFRHNVALCRAGLLKGCHFAFAHAEYSSRPTGEFKRRICELHRTDSFCQGDGVVPEQDELERMKEQCERGDLPTCWRVAETEISADLQKNGGVSAGELYDPTSGTLRLDQLCKWGHVESCDRLGNFYERRRPDGDPDVQRARHYYGLAEATLKSQCDAAIADGCAGLALRYEQGSHGVPRNRETAKQMTERACQLGLDGCSD